MTATRTPPTAPQPELFLTWKELYDRTESLWSKPLHEMLGTDTFARLMSATREGVLSQQQVSRESLETYWEQLRLPTKTDIARVAGQVVALEAKVENVSDRLEAIDATLGAIVTRLDALLARPQAGASEAPGAPEAAEQKRRTK